MRGMHSICAAALAVAGANGQGLISLGEPNLHLASTARSIVTISLNRSTYAPCETADATFKLRNPLAVSLDVIDPFGPDAQFELFEKRRVGTDANATWVPRDPHSLLFESFPATYKYRTIRLDPGQEISRTLSTRENSNLQSIFGGSGILCKPGEYRLVNTIQPTAYAEFSVKQPTFEASFEKQLDEEFVRYPDGTSTTFRHKVFLVVLVVDETRLLFRTLGNSRGTTPITPVGKEWTDDDIASMGTLERIAESSTAIGGLDLTADPGGGLLARWTDNGRGFQRAIRAEDRFSDNVRRR